jgi:hypothetical protein
MSNMGASPPQPVCRTLSLPQSDRRILGALNPATGRRGSDSPASGRSRTSPKSRHPRRAVARNNQERDSRKADRFDGNQSTRATSTALSSRSRHEIMNCPRPGIVPCHERTAVQAFVGWKISRNLLMQHVRFSHRLGEKPRKISAALGTHAPQQRALLHCRKRSGVLQ